MPAVEPDIRGAIVITCAACAEEFEFDLEGVELRDLKHAREWFYDDADAAGWKRTADGWMCADCHDE